MNDFFTVNLDRVISRKDIWGVTGSTAIKIKNGLIATVEDFLRLMTDDEMEFFMNEFNKYLKDDKLLIDSEFALQNITLLVIMLSTAEGLPPSSYEEIETYARQLPGFITLESLSRKGLVILKYENVSFDEEYAKKVIAERLI